MKINEAEQLLGLVNEKYDNTSVRLAYLNYRRKSNTKTAKKRAQDAQDTLLRYLTSRKKTGQVTYKERYQAKKNNAQTVFDMIFGKINNTTVDENNKTVENDALPDKNENINSLNLLNKWFIGHEEYINMRKDFRPMSNIRDSSKPILKATLMTLWDMTPWRFYLCFWSMIVSIIVWVFETLMPSGFLRHLNVVMGFIFIIGVIDFIILKTWKKTMRFSAAKIDKL